MPIADNLQKLRTDRKITQEQLAERSGVSLTQISKIERNETDPRVSTIEKLVKALGCSMDQLMFNEASEGLTGLLKRAFDRASRLDPLDKAALLKVINMACTGGTMIKTIDNLYDEASQEAEEIWSRHGHVATPEELVPARMEFEEMILDQNKEYHRNIDRLAEKEAENILEWERSSEDTQRYEDHYRGRPR